MYRIRTSVKVSEQSPSCDTIGSRYTGTLINVLPANMDSVKKLLDIMTSLRDPESGCPWDQQQDFASIAPYTLEEAYEVVHAIEQGDMDELCDELGDLMFHVVFYAQMAKEQSLFEFNDVIEAINDKLTRRHPHVFADLEINSAEEQTTHWEKLKDEERQAKRSPTGNDAAGTLAGINTSLPALTRAEKLQKRAATVGFDWPDVQGVIDKVNEELNEVSEAVASHHDKKAIEAEIGDLLFSCINLARKLGISPEMALRGCNNRFETRFRHMEEHCARHEQSLSELDPAQQNDLWEQAKNTR
ncbi:MAG: nucleoside triphosphate pyrophosphohydrolase [Gammaproteobacteria bacterium]|nr:MAG: nucleoside triphosphate pyrophosphohydrolase [Gammaproteobacteria bacterium]